MSTAIRIKIKNGVESKECFQHKPILFNTFDIKVSEVAKIRSMQKVSYKEAKKRGLYYYWTGKKCKRGHLSFRKIKTRQCVQCINRKNF